MATQADRCPYSRALWLGETTEIAFTNPHCPKSTEGKWLASGWVVQLVDSAVEPMSLVKSVSYSLSRFPLTSSKDVRLREGILVAGLTLAEEE